MAQGGKLLTFAVIAEAHLGLAEADRVFARTDAIELLELGLLDILGGSKLSAMSGKRGSSAAARAGAKEQRKHAPGWGSRSRWP
jgi:hypothetical protein